MLILGAIRSQYALIGSIPVNSDHISYILPIYEDLSCDLSVHAPYPGKLQ